MQFHPLAGSSQWMREVGATTAGVVLWAWKPQHKRNSNRQLLTTSFTKRNDLLADIPISEHILLLGRRAVWIFFVTHLHEPKNWLWVCYCLVISETFPGLCQDMDKARLFLSTHCVKGTLRRNFNKSTVCKAKEHYSDFNKVKEFCEGVNG